MHFYIHGNINLTISKIFASLCKINLIKFMRFDTVRAVTWLVCMIDTRLSKLEKQKAKKGERKKPCRIASLHYYIKMDEGDTKKVTFPEIRIFHFKRWCVELTQWD